MAQVVAAERQLMDPAVRGDRPRAAALLDPEFQEFASSGTAWEP